MELAFNTLKRRIASGLHIIAKQIFYTVIGTSEIDLNIGCNNTSVKGWFQISYFHQSIKAPIRSNSMT